MSLVGPATTAQGLRVVAFSSFYPHSARLGSHSTSLAWLLLQSPRVASITFFGNAGSSLPPGFDPARLEVVEAWTPDRPISLVRCALRMARRARETDVFLFNIYVTSFGRSPATNAIGLLLPIAVRRLTRRPTVAYVHNLVETQDIDRLGYSDRSFAVRVARTLERLLARNVRLVVPLESQAETARRSLGAPVECVVIPFAEGAFAASSALATSSGSPSGASPDGKLRVLLFGFWGPQKDLAGTLRTLAERIDRRHDVSVTVAGGVNPSFPDYAEEFRALRARYDSADIRFVGPVEELATFDLFRSHDVLLLAYRASGGTSGVMNLGALAGLRIVASGLPQLEELARELELPLTVYDARDPLGLEQALDRAVADGRTGSRSTPAEIRGRLERARDRAFELLTPPGRPRA